MLDLAETLDPLLNERKQRLEDGEEDETCAGRVENGRRELVHRGERLLGRRREARQVQVETHPEGRRSEGRRKGDGDES